MARGIPIPTKCYICEKYPDGKEEMVWIGKKLCRHKDCFAGSPNWMKSKRAKISELTPMFYESAKKREEKREEKRARKKGRKLGNRVLQRLKELKARRHEEKNKL